jgi:hypothetical protein
VATRDIRTSDPHTICDVCGRTLLRGERAEIYLHGGERHSVCELCKSRALHEGWIKEGTVPAYDDGNLRSDRRRSLFSRLKGLRAAPREFFGPDESDEALEASDEAARAFEPEPEPPRPARVPRQSSRPPAGTRRRERDRVREPRHVRAIPTSPEQRTAAAIEAFNSSEHTRTVAGVARSLGLPWVSVLPSTEAASLVNLAVSWELCWYRYEVDLSEEVPAVRLAGQGYELDELEPAERHPNAGSDEHGRLVLE